MGQDVAQVPGHIPFGVAAVERHVIAIPRDGRETA